jgi:hypothetical protein
MNGEGAGEASFEIGKAVSFWCCHHSRSGAPHIPFVHEQSDINVTVWSVIATNAAAE